MFNKALTLKLCRDLWQRRWTLLALVLVLTVGIGNYTGMAGVYRDLDQAKTSYYHKYNLADFTIDLKRAPAAFKGANMVAPLQDSNNILRLRQRIKTEIMLQLPNTIQLIPGNAVSLPVPRRNIINNLKLVRGTWFSSNYAHEAIIEQQFANNRHIHIGDRLNVRLPDKEYNILVVGIADAPEFAVLLAPGTIIPDPGSFAAIYLPHGFLQQATNLNGSFNQLLGLVRDNSLTAINNTMTLLSDKLDPYGVLLKTPQSQETSVQVLNDELVNIKKSNSFLPTIFLLVAALILNVMLSRLVVQQRSTIGILKAIGYNNFAILRHYLSYGIVLGLLGGIFGDALGYWLQTLMLKQYEFYFAIPDMQPHLHIKIFLFGIGISVFSAFLGAISGAYKATKLSPAIAMRPPTPEKGVHIIVERFSYFWKHLTFQGKMIMRAIFRNRFRSLVTICASILATALVFSALSFFDSIYEMIESSFDHVQHQDYQLTLREPLGNDIISTLTNLPGVKTLETQLSVAAELEHGPFQKRLAIIGLPKQHKLYTPVDKNNLPIAVTSSGIVINQTLANILHTKIGDTITLRPLIGNRTPAKVRVNNIIKTYMGLSVYANQTWLSRLLGDTSVSNNILFLLQKDIDATAFIKAVNKFGPMINLTAREQQKQQLIYSFDQFLVFAVIILIIFAAVIAIGAIINTSMISLNERERDVSSLRVLGFTVWQTARIFFGESLILNSMGIVLGIFAGIFLDYIMSIAFSTELYRMPMIINNNRIWQSIIIMLSFVVIAQLIIYRIIKKLNWLEVLNARE